MKSTISTRIIGATLFTVLVMPVRIIAQEQSAAEPENSRHTRYTILDLGKLGGPASQPWVITNNGLISGAADVPDGAMQAVLWYGLKIDIGKPGLGGPNSAAYGVNEKGQAVGEAQTSDPNDEDFCGFNALGLKASNTSCLPFLWDNGAMQPLPTLGGANGVANMINNRGEAVGFAEKNWQEKGCPVFQFEPVIWKDGKVHELPTYPGDPDGLAAFINDKGQVVGSSGTCGQFNPATYDHLVENHALLWEKDGSVHDLGNLGGEGGLAGNHACAINNRSQVVGHSVLKDNSKFHGFLWTKETGMHDLGTLPGDAASLALGINDRGQVAGASLGAGLTTLRAFVWENGHMTDLNTLVRGRSNLYLLLAESINDYGEMVGLAATSSGELHGFLAIPRDRDHDGCDDSENADCR